MPKKFEEMTDQEKAQRLDELRGWLKERHRMAARSRDYEKERSHAGSLFFIETGKLAFQESEGFYGFARDLRREARGIDD